MTGAARKTAEAGRWLYAAGMAGFGTHLVLHANVAGVGAPAAAWIAMAPWQASLIGLALIACAAAVAARWKTRWAAALLAMVLLRFVVVHWGHLLADPHSPGPWSGGFEIFGLVCVAAVLMDDGQPGTLTTAARSLLGGCLVVFGVQHLLYPRFVALFMPAWIPGRQFWAYAAAVSFFAAALCFVAALFAPPARRLAPLAATLLGVMYLIFLLSVHLFRIAAAPHSAVEWSAGLMALSWCGGAWILAGAPATLSRR